MSPTTSDEARRLAAVCEARILDTETSADFDALTDHLCELFNVPVSLVSILDKDRQWFKSNHGMPVRETSRDIAFCNHTVLGNDVFVVEDARIDPRFSTNSLVTSNAICFYAGAPLLVEPGVALGSLCVIDTVPRTFASDQIRTLQRLATIAVSLIMAHRSRSEAEEAASKARALEASSQIQSRELLLRERRFRQTEAMAGIGGWEVDLATNTVLWSDEIYRIFGVPVQSPITLDQALRSYPAEEGRRLTAMIEETIATGKGYRDDFRIITEAGEDRWVRTAGEVEYRDGVPARLFGIVQDITERHLIDARLWATANCDGLTGLANRNQFTQTLHDLLEGPTDSHAGTGLLMIDVDHLKEVNDTLGHAAGDELIRTVARRLVTACGQNGLASRIGGDEFAVILPGTGRESALHAVATRILEAMQARLDFHGTTLVPEVSIGGAFHRKGDTAEILRQKADIALYHAKDTARGTFVGFSESLRTAITTRLTLARSLDRALEDGRVEAHYQPLVNLRTGRIEGLEALARVRNTSGGLKTAGEYASALDDSRNAVRLTTSMLANICRDLARWKALGLTVGRVALNVTTHDFRTGELEQRIIRAFETAGLPLAMLTMEVTETVFLSRVADEVSRVVARLRERGVRIALDDFGTGYASLASLGTLPVDAIKIDRSFVMRMLTDTTSDAITRALIELGHRLDISVVAEGVETQQQLDHLTSLGCQVGQGFLFARPLPANDIITFVGAFSAPRRTAEPNTRVHYVG